MPSQGQRSGTGAWLLLAALCTTGIAAESKKAPKAPPAKSAPAAPAPAVLPAAKAEPAKPALAPRVVVAPYSGIISPVAAEFLESAVSRANEGGFSALVIELDTPGGLDTSMRKIVQAILASKVPVVVYVFPPGGRAASAGVFITMSAHVAAMAPSTNIGAAHPVMLGTGAPGPEKEPEGKADKTMEGKLVNDAAAYLKSIAHTRGRNEDWAFQAVTQSTSVPAAEAVELNVVDLVAPSLEDLLREIDGREISSLSLTLRTAGARIERVEMTRRQRWLATLSDPNVAMILMSLGAAGLFIELYNPGLILPGIVGAISLILAFYSFQTLSASYAGILLILLGMLLFVIEIKVASHGVLSLGGATAMLLGILMLFRQQAAGGLRVSWDVALGSTAAVGGAAALCSYLAYKAYRRRVVTGAEAMVGARGRALTALAPQGKARVGGELWDAVSTKGDIAEGAEIVVVSVDGLTLRVRPSAPS